MRVIRKAFSFIEFLVALTIFSIIALSVYYALTTGVKLYYRGNSKIKHNQGIRGFFDRISLDFKNSFFDSGISPQFSESEVDFATLANTRETGRRIMRVIYSYNSAQGEITRSCSGQSQGFSDQAEGREVILEGVGDLSFEYCYEGLMPDGPYEWKDYWSQPEIPKGLRVNLRLKGQPGFEGELFREYIFIPTGAYGPSEE